MTWGIKCLPASVLKSSIHLAYHKENWEMPWPWHIKIPSWGKKSCKELFYPVKKAKPDTSWRQIQIRKQKQIFTPRFHYPSEMADLHNLMSSKMMAFLDKRNLVVWSDVLQCMSWSSAVCPHLCPALSCCCSLFLHHVLPGALPLLLHPGAPSCCVRMLKKGLFKVILGSKVWLYFHILCHSKTPSIPSVFRAAWKHVPIFPQKYFY